MDEQEKTDRADRGDFRKLVIFRLSALERKVDQVLDEMRSFPTLRFQVRLLWVAAGVVALLIIEKVIR